MEFYICKHCLNVIAYLNNSGVEVECCSEPMQLMVANSSDGAKEKHVPVITKDANIITVTVGSALHPMSEAHHIAWIALETKKGNQRVVLNHTGKPEATFVIADDDEVINAYAYCNLHGLFKAK